jgi:hypothetical protein
MICRVFSGITLGTALFLAPMIQAQDRGRDFDRDRRDDGDRMTRILPGTNVTIRTDQTIDVERRDNRVYTGIVEQDVRGDNGRLAIPRGSTVELIVRVARDNDLALDLESVSVNGQRYGIRTDSNRIESERDNSLVGAIVGAINGGQAQGRAVRVPAGTLLTFRIQRPLDMGVADRGIMRDGRHYHDYYGDRDR